MGHWQGFLMALVHPLRLAAVVFFIFNGLQVSAAIDVYEFDTAEQRQRYQVFTEEMRCPKCQNQNLAGSDSPIAADLRRELHRLLIEGRSDEAITDYMVARYGDFILYKPRLQKNTYLLWLAPLGLLIIGLSIVAAIFMGRKKTSDTTLTGDAQARLDALLDDSTQDKS